MKKHIANVITGSRIALSLPLLFFPLPSVWFFILYFLCGFTDMIDGAVARRMGAVSKFGAKLDTASDFVFTLICSAKILPHVHIPIWLWVWIALIALVKVLNVALVFIREKKLLSVHSVLNKITGFTLFLLPLTLTFVNNIYSVAAVCVLATIAAMQEAYFIAKGQEVL